MNDIKITQNENKKQNNIGTNYSSILSDQEKKIEKLKDDYKPLEKKKGILNIAESILKHPARVIHETYHSEPGNLILIQLIISIICLLAYGLTAGMFSMGTQLWAAPLKITAGALFSAIICLPSLFVFSCLAGADSKLSQITAILTGTVTVSSLLLLAFGPISWLFSQSTESLVFMGLLHLIFWGIAINFGFQYLKNAMALANDKHGKQIAIWCLIFVLVTLQMTTTLRPIIGTSERLLQKEKKFFVTHWADQM